MKSKEAAHVRFERGAAFCAFEGYDKMRGGKERDRQRNCEKNIGV